MSIQGTPGSGYTKPLPGSTRYKPTPTGVELIAAERQRQIDAEGWLHAHDDSHTSGQLVAAAAAYIHQQANGMPMTSRCWVPHLWPWSDAWWKPSSDEIRNLVKAGALLAAEIDRLQRKRNAPNGKDRL